MTRGPQYLLFFIIAISVGCQPQQTKEVTMQHTSAMTAEHILSHPEYLAISYGGYRQTSRDQQPTVAQLKADMQLLSAIGIKILRTYNVHLPHASNVLKAIRELKEEQPGFEMYVMLGAWIDCKNAWTDQPLNHQQESPRNAKEIAKAIELAQEYPDIVKVIAVGNEAMVHWQAGYWVTPAIILKWVNHLQDQKKAGELPADLWVTSSDDFSSWGGGGPEYHTDTLNALIKAVDYISMHTYPMHNTHYNPQFWGIAPEESRLSKAKQIDLAMERSLAFAQQQVDSVRSYMQGLGVNKPIHIGETGWATVASDLYGANGSQATDEYKGGLYYHLMREWTREQGMACFYFEAFDEPWKDGQNPQGSENHFGLFTKEGQAKYALWGFVDQGAFEGLGRGEGPVQKTFGGDSARVLDAAFDPPINAELGKLHQHETL